MKWKGSKLFKAESIMIPIDKLEPCQFDIIKEIDRQSHPEYIASLTEDIKSRGILVPLMVKEKAKEPGKYKIICGNNRHSIAKTERNRGSKDFDEVRCDILKDEIDLDNQEITAILDNMNRRMLTPIARHLMIARYKEKIEALVAPHYEPGRGKGYKVGKVQDPSIKEAIQGIKKEGSLDKFISRHIGVATGTVAAAQNTVAAIRFKINSETKEMVAKTDPNRAESVTKALAKVPIEFTREVFDATPEALVKQWKGTSLTAPTKPIKTITLNDKKSPGDWRKLEGIAAGEVRKLKGKGELRFSVQIKVWKVGTAP